MKAVAEMNVREARVRRVPRGDARVADRAPLTPVIAPDQLKLSGPLTTPDFQKTLALDKAGNPTGSWYDSKGVANGRNQDAADIAALSGGDPALYDYLTQGQGPVDIYVGGVGEEDHPWIPPIPAEGQAPALALNYALNPHVGPLSSYWWPVGTPHWDSSVLPFDGWEGIPHIGDSVDYGAYLLDKLVSKVEAAGASQVRVFAHSKGSWVSGTALHDPVGRYDRMGDSKLAPVMTFAMPFVAPYSPRQWAGKSESPHWGGFWRTENGRLLIFNRESDFTTYGGWVNMPSHDYSHLVQDSNLGPYPGDRGQSPPWSPSENFVARYRDFSAGSSTSDQSAAALSYDW